jgi:HEAT repeats
MGNKVLPTLLRMLRARDSKLKLLLISLAAKQHLMKLHFIPAARLNQEAVMAFYILGSATSNAVPDLLQIYREGISANSQRCALDSIGWIGPAAKPAVPELLRIVGDTNSDSAVRITAIAVLVRIRVDLESVFPALINCLSDPDWDVALTATRELMFLGSAARPAVPALVNLLNDPDHKVKELAEQALKAIDPQAAAKAGVQ